uniref:RNA helicase n=1 Tax=Euglena gracilis TaxID=3039 RepID=A0AA51U9F8_EUGGR|nr:putative ATP-dependent RNA helicase DDX5/DDX17 [Euglena gracilis]BDX17140.1 probable ATP-dependent RNA helicase DDX5/DDX17 C [Euglena gracilis]
MAEEAAGPAKKRRRRDEPAADPEAPAPDPDPATKKKAKRPKTCHSFEDIICSLLRIEADEQRARRKAKVKAKAKTDEGEESPVPAASATDAVEEDVPDAAEPPKEKKKRKVKSSHAVAQNEPSDIPKASVADDEAASPRHIDQAEDTAQSSQTTPAASGSSPADSARLLRYAAAMNWDADVRKELTKILAGKEPAKPGLRVAYRRRPPASPVPAAEQKPAAVAAAKFRAQPKEYTAVDAAALKGPKPLAEKVAARQAKKRSIHLRELMLFNCPDGITEGEVANHYASLGPNTISKISFAFNKEPGQEASFLGYGRVRFLTAALAEQAARLPPPEVAGQQLRIAYDPLCRVLGKYKRLKLQKDDDYWKRLQGIGEDALAGGRWTMERMAAHPIHKNLSTHLRRIHRTERETAAQLGSTVVDFEGGMLPPLFGFQEVDFGAAVNDRLQELFEAPMPIQGFAWPAILTGRDCIGLAETGSGKTLAYLLPARTHLQYHLEQRAGEGPIVLVVVPSRELAQQIADQFEAWRLDLPYTTGAVTGGKPPEDIQAALKCDVVVATPARLLKALHDRAVDLSRVSFAVLDEADHLLDLGFAVQVATICSQLRPDRQTCMFSATWLRDIRELAKQVLIHPLKVTINEVSTGLANPNIQQNVIVVARPTQKRRALRELLERIRQPDVAITRMIIFAEHRHRVSKVVRLLQPLYSGVLPYTADLEQEQREKHLSAFRADPHGVLVCTNVAAHGLDIKDVAFVVNYDLPAEISQYVHRIGRTGRAGRPGTAYSLYHPDTDWPIVRQLIRCIRLAGQEVPAELYGFAKQTGAKKEARKGHSSDGRVQWGTAQNG